MSVRITRAESDDDVARVRELVLEYGAALGVDLGFQGFEAEVGGLPGQYVPPGGRLLLAWVDGELAGCAGLRPLEPAGEGPRSVGEMKRLYVRPRFRGRDLGRTLAAAVIAEAHSAGYRALRLDTLPTMTAAHRLYRSLGFREIAPYADSPIPGTVFFELELG